MSLPALGASAPQDGTLLPFVVQFSHTHEISIEPSPGGTRVVARVKPGMVRAPSHASALPFVGRLPNGVDFSWWYFPKASSDEEAEERGRYFWQQFVAYGQTKRGRKDRDYAWLLQWILRDMQGYPDGAREAHAFVGEMTKAVVAQIREGVGHVAAQ